MWLCMVFCFVLCVILFLFCFASFLVSLSFHSFTVFVIILHKHACMHRMHKRLNNYTTILEENLHFNKQTKKKTDSNSPYRVNAINIYACTSVFMCVAIPIAQIKMFYFHWVSQSKICG